MRTAWWLRVTMLCVGLLIGLMQQEKNTVVAVVAFAALVPFFLWQHRWIFSEGWSRRPIPALIALDGSFLAFGVAMTGSAGSDLRWLLVIVLFINATCLTGAALCCAGLFLGGRRVTRTRYRPDPWRLPEWTVAGCGIASAVLIYLSASYNAAQVDPSYYPLHFPPLPPTRGSL